MGELGGGGGGASVATAEMPSLRGGGISSVALKVPTASTDIGTSIVALDDEDGIPCKWMFGEKLSRRPAAAAAKAAAVENFLLDRASDAIVGGLCLGVTGHGFGAMYACVGAGAGGGL